MAKLLYINANPKTDSTLSKGLQIGEAFLEKFKKHTPDVEIEIMHLYNMEVPEIDMDLLYGRVKLSFMRYTFEQLSEVEQMKITKNGKGINKKRHGNSHISHAFSCM